MSLYGFFLRRGKKDNKELLLAVNKGADSTASLSSNSNRKANKGNGVTPATLSQQGTTSSDGKCFKYNEAGRRYHGNDEVSYMLPNDDDEQDRLHSQHWVLRNAFQRNYHAPVAEMLEEGITVLDSGCGPATWTFEMSEAYPQSKFCAVDVSFVFPETIRPTNVDLQVANIAKHIPYPDNTFDYVFQRLLVAGLTDDNWTNALKELYRISKPGAYVELVESSLCDIVNGDGPAWQKIQDVTSGIFRCRGIPEKVATELESRLVQAGFVDPVLQTIPLPLNHDGKRGQLVWGDLRNGYSAMRPAMAKISPEWNDPKIFEAHLKELDVEAEKNKVCVTFYVIYARKPLNK